MATKKTTKKTATEAPEATETPEATYNVNINTGEDGEPQRFPQPKQGILAEFCVRVLTLADFDWLMALMPHDLQPRKLRHKAAFWTDLIGEGGRGYTPWSLRGLPDLPIVVGNQILCGAGRLGTLILAATGFGKTGPNPEHVKAILRAGVISVYYQAECPIDIIRELISDNDSRKESWNVAQCYTVYSRARRDGVSGVRAVVLAGGGDRVKLEKLWIVDQHYPEHITRWQDSIGTDNPVPVGIVAKLGEDIRKYTAENPASADVMSEKGKEINDKLVAGKWSQIQKSKPATPAEFTSLARFFDNDETEYPFTGKQLATLCRNAAGYKDHKSTPASKGLFVRRLKNHAEKHVASLEVAKAVAEAKAKAEAQAGVAPLIAKAATAKAAAKK